MLVQGELSRSTDESKPVDDGEEEDAPLLHQQSNGIRLWNKVSDHLPKLLLVGLLCLSALILVLVSNRGETGALLCIESQLSKDAQGVPYPAVNFQSVRKLADTGVYSTVHAENWIVVAVSGPPTEEIHTLGKLAGWKVVAIGDGDTHISWNVSGVIYLSPQQQAALGYRILAHLPNNAFVRKSVGYLFAIQHGAKKIYDADENGLVIGDDLSKAFDLELSGPNSRRQPMLQYLSIENRTCVNPYIHFGQRSVWPRGLPLSLVSKIDSENFYGQVLSGNHFIQQGLTMGLPDVDSIFYRTRKSGIEPFVINFDTLAPPVALPLGTMAPLNGLNTLFHSTAFWALMLPVSVGTKASDIMRGYWAQRLLWEIGGYLTIHPPSVYRIDKMEPPYYVDEKDVHKNVGRLTTFLVAWSSKKFGLYQKALHLSHSMAEAGFWTAQDVIFTAAWLQDLVSIGYRQPRVLDLDIDKGITLQHREEHREFIPMKLPSVHLGIEEATSVAKDIQNLIKWRNFFGNIVLILECMSPFNHTALAWKMLYGRIFKSVMLFSEYSDDDFGVGMSYPLHSYTLLPAIFTKFPNAEGFLFMKDDVILNYWTLLGVDKNKLWSLHKVSNSWRILNYKKEGPAWFYKNQIKKEVRDMLSLLPLHNYAMYRANVDKNHYVVCRSNLFYIPHGYVQEFANLVELGVKVNVRHEVAVPLFLLAMESKQRFDGEAFSDTVYKPTEGDNSAAYYSTRVHAVYPWYAKNALELQRIIKAMGGGDPLLLKYVQ